MVGAAEDLILETSRRSCAVASGRRGTGFRAFCKLWRRRRVKKSREREGDVVKGPSMDAASSSS